MMKKNIFLIVIIVVVVVGLALWLLVFSEGAGTFLGMKKNNIKSSSSSEFESLMNKASYLTDNEIKDLKNIVPGKIYIVPEDNFCLNESFCKDGFPLMQKGSYFVMTGSEENSSVNRELLGQVSSEPGSQKQTFEISETENPEQRVDDTPIQPWSRPDGDCPCGCLGERILRVFVFDGNIFYWWELRCSKTTCANSCIEASWYCQCGTGCCWEQ